MIYWTPLDLEQVFQGWEGGQPTVEITKEGLLLQVEPLGDGKGKVVRLISGNPADYLRTDLAPGAIVTMV